MKILLGTSTFGLVASSLLTIVSNCSLFANQVAELSVQMTSAERVIEFTKVKPEAPLRLKKRKPPLDWPSNASIRMDNLCLGYGNGPLVLQNISINIMPKEKVIRNINSFIYWQTEVISLPL